MMEQFPQFRKKSREELENQLYKVESQIGQKLVPENKRNEIFFLTSKELKERYPLEYERYMKTLRIGTKNLELANESVDTKYSSEEYNEICSKVITKSEPISDELYKKLEKDENLKEYQSPVIFFPEIYERIYDNNEKAKLYRLPTTTRPGGFKVDFDDISYIVKALESRAEKSISEKAGELGIGPKQFRSLEGNLTEEFIDGKPFLELEKEKCTPEFMKDLGTQFAKALKILHENDILVNDQILTNDFGKSHMIIDKESKVRFIDFGASINISNFPDILDEEVLSLMRTDPFMAFRIGNIRNLSEDELKIEIVEYRKNILSQYKTKEDIIQAKDMQLLNEGVYFLQGRLPNVSSFIEGINT